MPIPLSQIGALLELLKRRGEITARIQHYEHLVSLAGFFDGDGTSPEPLPDSLLPAVRQALIEAERADLAALDEELRAAAVDPEN